MRRVSADGARSMPVDQGLNRFDVNPTVRIPFTRIPFLTLNSTVAWRGTYWTESLNAASQQVPEALKRQSSISTRG